ncbi:Paxillin-like protein 1 [Kluyveromyces marxianus]
MERAGFDVVSPTSPSGSKAPSIRTGSRVVSHGSYASGAGKKVVNKGPMGNGPAKGPFHPYASSQQVHSKSADSVYRKGVTPPGTTPGPGKSVPGVIPAHHYRQMSPGSLSVDQAFHRLNGEGQGQGQNQNQNQEQEQAFDKVSFDFERRADSENSISSEKQQPVFPPVPMSMSSPNLNSNSSSTYNTPQLGAGPAGAGSFPAIDPVEQSFQQLTNEKRGKPEERQEEEEEEDDDDDYVPDLAPKTDLQSLQGGAVPTPVPASNQNDSISFEPNEALNKVLESAPQSVPGIFVTQEHEEPEQEESEQEEPDTFSDSELPLEPEPALQLGLKGEPEEEEEEEEPEVASVNGHVTDQTLVESQSPAQAQAQPRAASPLPHATITHVPHRPEHEGKLTAMEKLIAELDTVTLAREEEQLNIPTASFMPQTVNKKSSAYMSRYEPQRIIIPDSPPAVGNSHMSIQSNSTPTFYKFRKDLGPLAPEMEEEQHHQQQQEQQQQQQEHSSVPPPAKLKFPPGQGPCRHCNKEVLHKGIYSKHENELSGQWHRGCFKCITTTYTTTNTPYATTTTSQSSTAPQTSATSADQTPSPREEQD